MEDGSQMVTCPYDNGHRLLAWRLPYHLKRCSSNDPRKHLYANKKQCDFDASHVVDVRQYEAHLKVCEAARKIISSKSHVKNDEGELAILPVNNVSTSNTDDWGTGDWATEAPLASYDPQEAIKNRAIPHNVIGLSKAERKKYRVQQRRRINQLNANGPVNKA